MSIGVPKPLNLPFDPIERAAETWRVRFGPSSAMAAVTSIMRAHQILIGQLDTLLRPHDLTFARYEALVLLTFSRTGALSLSRIGERLMVHPTSVTNTIDRLERAGLVRRMRNPKDGRGVLAEITAKGREVVERATADLMGADFCMTMYGDGEKTEIFGLLRTMRVAAGDFPAFEEEDEVLVPGRPGAGPSRRDGGRGGDAKGPAPKDGPL